MKALLPVLITLFISGQVFADGVIHLQGVDEARVRQTCDLYLTTDPDGELTRVRIVSAGYPAGLDFVAENYYENKCHLGHMGKTQNSNGGFNFEFRALNDAQMPVRLTLSYDFHGALASYSIGEVYDSPIPACIAGRVTRKFRDTMACFGLNE